MEMTDVLAKMDERLARQDEILARMDDRTADQARLLEHLTRLVDVAREEAQAGRETSARILQRMLEWDIRHDRTWERLERALTTLEQTLRQRGGLTP